MFDNNYKNNNTDNSIIIDKELQRFPYCIVWTPLPFISWFIPLIGHTGICTSAGVIHDFAGSETISVDNLAFGETHKYVYLNPSEEERKKWDYAIYQSDKKYSNEEHNLFTNNCHSHVAHALNKIPYEKFSKYNMIHIWWLCLTRSKYVSTSHMIKTYLGFITILILIIYFTKFR